MPKALPKWVFKLGPTVAESHVYYDGKLVEHISDVTIQLSAKQGFTKATLTIIDITGKAKIEDKNVSKRYKVFNRKDGEWKIYK